MNLTMKNNECPAVCGLYEIVKALSLIRSAERVTDKPGDEEVRNLPAAFDIETTQTERGAYMYVWQIAVGWYPENYAILTGRTWEELKITLETLRAASERSAVVFYVHNLSYEHSFMRRIIESIRRKDGSDEVFATANRHPIRWKTDGFEWRCSAALSHESLEEVGKHLVKYRVEKASGDLDYKIPRNSKTPLTPVEWGYCYRDVEVVIAYIREKMEEHGGILEIPMTSTGEVRKDVRSYVLGDPEVEKYIGDGFITLPMYNLLKNAYQGGYVHASPYHAGEVLHNIGSIDFTSSYPAVILLKKYPAGGAVYLKGDKEIRHAIKHNPETGEPSPHWVARVRYHGLEWSHALPDCTLSVSKCETDGKTVDLNGRIMYSQADVVTYVTEIDHFWIMRNYYTRGYDFEEAVVYPRSDFLPLKLREKVMEYYRKKTTLKGVSGSEQEYMQSKARLNSIYGMMVTALLRESFETVGGVWQEPKTSTEKGKSKSLSNQLKSKGRFLNYVSGVYVTAWARSNLFDGMENIGIDYVYSDTDSIKMINPDRHADYIKQYNEEIRRTSIEIYGEAEYYRSLAPADIKGKRHPIGEWDFEGVYTTFKALRAKAYLTETNGEYNLTLAGCGKKSGTRYFSSLPDPWSAFNTSMTLPPEVVDKLIPSHIDEPVTETIIDQFGNVETMTSPTGQRLEPVGFDSNTTFADCWNHICTIVRNSKT